MENFADGDFDDMKILSTQLSSDTIPFASAKWNDMKWIFEIILTYFMPFGLYLLKSSGNLGISDFSGGNRKRPEASNGLIKQRFIAKGVEPAIWSLY